MPLYSQGVGSTSRPWPRIRYNLEVDSLGADTMRIANHGYYHMMDYKPRATVAATSGNEVTRLRTAAEVAEAHGLKFFASRCCR